jgi:16S rRNA (cytosine967-C5)-methyltransferase
VVRCDLFDRGRITVQGETALRAAELLEASEGELVLDLCAAPGGKTAALAQTGARVVACDVEPRRLERLTETILRLRPRGAVEVHSLDRAPGAGAAGAPVPGGTSYDGVLVDVPCSNTGVLAQRPAARWRFDRESMRSLSEVQAALLERGAGHVRPGGRLVYSTCSLEPEENHRRVAAFLTAHPEFSLDVEIETLPDPRGEHGPVDGGYAARLRRS